MPATPSRRARAGRLGPAKAAPVSSGCLARCARRLLDPADTRAALAVAVLVLLGEALLTGLIIRRVPYTEIDWSTYMEQLAVIDKGERDYARIGGATGPLVYPAGHVWLHRALRWATGGGSIPRAQVLSAGLYLSSQAIALGLTIAAGAVPPVALPLLAASKRLHSIYVLRLFNDCWSATLAYAATALFLAGRTATSILAFSAAVSIKMSALLFGPPVLVAALRWSTPSVVTAGVAAGAALQVALAAPFLAAAPWSYATRAFELSRAFLYKWTVNLRFLPEPIFASPTLSAGLLATHALLLAAFASTRWVAGEPGGLLGVAARFWARGFKGKNTRSRSIRSKGAATAAAPPPPRPPPGPALAALATGNLLGIAAARSLHYQFYAWYAQSLPLLLWGVDVEGALGRAGRRKGVRRAAPGKGVKAAAVLLRLGVWAGVEAAWNVFPATPASSSLLTAMHVLLVAGLWWAPAGWTQGRNDVRV